MTIKTAIKNVPDHLVGTREALFHLLRSTSIDPLECAASAPETQGVIRYQGVMLHSQSPQTRKRHVKPQEFTVADYLKEDAFYFKL